MLILAVDTTGPSGSLAVLQKSQVLATVSSDTDEPYSSRLFRQLDFLLKEVHLQISQFDLFAVAAGPGSFTGLRVGLTAVKGWAEVYTKPVAAVSALEAVAVQSRKIAAGCLLAAVVDARRGEVYGGLYDNFSERSSEWRRGPDVVMPFSEFVREVEGRAGDRAVHLVTTTPDLLKKGVAELASTVPPEKAAKPSWVLGFEVVSPVLAPFIGQIGLWRARRGQVVDALTLDAHYVRRSDAERLWKD